MRIFSILIFAIALQSCNNNESKNTTMESPIVKEDLELDPLDVIEREQQAYLDSTKFYVMAPNGLSLRQKPNFKSARIAIMPKGSTLKMTEAIHTVDTIIGGVPGSIVAVNYKGTDGYAFSGYLTSYYIPVENMAASRYSEIVKSNQPNATYNERKNDADFHDGYNSELVLPNCSWQEAYYIAMALYEIPKSLEFPGHIGSSNETTSQLDKDKDTWTSDLMVSRSKKKIDTLHYIYRAEGFGWQVKIMEEGDHTMRIEHLAFVD